MVNKSYRLRGDTFKFALSGITIQVFGAISGPLLAYSLGSVGRGLLVAVIAPFISVAFLAAYGAAQLVGHAAARGAWSPKVLFAYIVTPWLPAGVVLALVLRNQDLWVVITSIFALLFFISTAIVQQLCVGLRRPYLFCLVALTPFGINVLGLLGLLLFRRVTPHSALAAQYIGYACGGVVSVLLVRGLWSTKKERDGSGEVRLRRLLPATGAGLSPLAFASFDQVVMTRIVSPSSVGHYVVANSYASLLEAVVVAVSFTFFGKISREKGPSVELKSAYRSTFWLSILGVVFMSLTAPIVIPLAFGDDFGPSVHLAWLLLVGRIFHDLYAVSAIRLVGDVAGANLFLIGFTSLALVAAFSWAGASVAGVAGATSGVALAEAVRFLLANSMLRYGRKSFLDLPSKNLP